MPPASRRTCKDIARQLVEDQPGRSINVLLGGGRRHWVSAMTRDPEEPQKEGRRLDGRNLVEDWLRDKKGRGLKAQYIWNKRQLQQVDVRTLDHLLGIFAFSHLEFEADGSAGPSGDPTLLEMTRIAVQLLLKNPRGFFLFIEGLDNKLSDVDGKPYSTLLYGNGPGYSVPRSVPHGNYRDVVQAAAIPRTWSTHGGEDVPVFAVGPLSSLLFSGTFDQSYIPHAIAYVACLGEYAKRCTTGGKMSKQSCSDVPSLSAVMADDSSSMNQSYMLKKQISEKNNYLVNQPMHFTGILLFVMIVLLI
ncbi:hypothetical protein B7P43_G09519 [Cryptotermes secundus]|uniref:alkaline phosphatase n=1 Tax=Cryptotermes secundus TaxID=105785 RepID=A0A2J7PSB6_9NEOP|nr:hypothetical protein B7P43_G09519 [Cryptotermes secundus]